MLSGPLTLKISHTLSHTHGVNISHAEKLSISQDNSDLPKKSHSCLRDFSHTPHTFSLENIILPIFIICVMFIRILEINTSTAVYAARAHLFRNQRNKARHSPQYPQCSSESSTHLSSLPPLSQLSAYKTLTLPYIRVFRPSPGSVQHLLYM